MGCDRYTPRYKNHPNENYHYDTYKYQEYTTRTLMNQFKIDHLNNNFHIQGSIKTSNREMLHQNRFHRSNCYKLFLPINP